MIQEAPLEGIPLQEALDSLARAVSTCCKPAIRTEQEKEPAAAAMQKKNSHPGYRDGSLYLSLD
ncbi:protein of unknown function [Nitrospina watsonii]|uniref:Uncharacterized protein n=1 Tax=Nitrospina watsonii TaxID=1323948 RepID=A0ABM9HH32_9BACT|nr:protein of unknown function [Nitrospina watsonii]